MHPGAMHYESQRKKAGAHLLFNAFWLIPHFCVNLMYMRDPMHQIDNGIIISFLKAILRKYRECVESTMDKNWIGSQETDFTFQTSPSKIYKRHRSLVTILII